MSLLALGAMVVAAVVVGSVALPVVADQVVGGEHDEGSDLAAATGAAVRQANDVGDSFGRLVPARAGAAREGDGAGRARAGPGSPPISSHASGPDDDAQHEVAAALEALASADAGRSGAVSDAGIVAIEALRDAWSPRYRQAQEERRRLAYRIEHAERAARRYFGTQAELTGRIKDPGERSRAGAGDLAEMRLYARWRDQAHRTRAQTDSIMNDLHDMDIRITKRLLSADLPRSTTTSWSCPLPCGTCTGTWSGFGSGRRRWAPPSAGTDPRRAPSRQTKPLHTKQGENRCW